MQAAFTFALKRSPPTGSEGFAVGAFLMSPPIGRLIGGSVTDPWPNAGHRLHLGDDLNAAPWHIDAVAGASSPSLAHAVEVALDPIIINRNDIAQSSHRPAVVQKCPSFELHERDWLQPFTPQPETLP